VGHFPPGQSQFVMLAGCRIHYLRWARAPAKPGVRGLLFVHGGGAHSRWWSYISPYLTRDFRVAAIDLSGMGDSGWRSHYTSEFGREVFEEADADALACGCNEVGHVFQANRRRHSIRAPAMSSSAVSPRSRQPLPNRGEHGINNECPQDRRVGWREHATHTRGENPTNEAGCERQCSV
jgi:hypothetical protein